MALPRAAPGAGYPGSSPEKMEALQCRERPATIDSTWRTLSSHPAGHVRGERALQPASTCGKLEGVISGSRLVFLRDNRPHARLQPGKQEPGGV